MYRIYTSSVYKLYDNEKLKGCTIVQSIARVELVTLKIKKLLLNILCRDW